jgi:hypothetical protein
MATPSSQPPGVNVTQVAFRGPLSWATNHHFFHSQTIRRDATESVATATIAQNIHGHSLPGKLTFIEKMLTTSVGS